MWSVPVVLGVIGIFIVINQLFVAASGSSDGLLLKLLGVTVVPYLYMFLLGVVLNGWRERLLPFLAGRAAWWLAAFVVVTLIASALAFAVSGNVPNPLSATVLALLVVSCAYAGSGVANRLQRGNDISYGVYLYHMVVVNVLVTLGLREEPLAVSAAIAITIALATASWLLVERPALRLKRRSYRTVAS